MTSPYIYILPLLLQQIWGISAFNNSTQFANPSGMKSSHTKRILGGKPIRKIKHYPFMASLQDILELGTIFCGATIIHTTWALTAARCLYDEYRERRATYQAVVITGLLNIKYTSDLNLNYPAKLIPHEQFKFSEVVNDIGLILLDEPVKLVAPNEVAKLPFDLFKPWDDPIDFYWSCRIMGWGYVSVDEDLSKKLMYIDIPFITQSDCSEKLKPSYWPENGICEDYTPPTLNDRVICAENYRVREAGCYGDTGGPLICDKYQIGILSVVYVDCVEEVDYPNVFVRLDLYLKWILTKIPKEEFRSLGNILRKLSIVFTFIEIWTVI